MTLENSGGLRPSILERIHGKYQRTASRLLCRRIARLPLRKSIISFTFDDFPVSAIRTGGSILRSHGFRGTYYASLGLRGTQAPTGEMFDDRDFERVIEDGHELGCHTFDHRHSWATTRVLYEQSITANANALEAIFPGARFATFSYPIAEPHPFNKKTAGARFRACRGGGQTHNRELADLALLSSYFLEKTQGDMSPVYHAIDESCRDDGWLIFSTHDVCDSHTPYGCTPAFFERVVAYAAKSGAEVLPVDQALNRLGIG